MFFRIQFITYSRLLKSPYDYFLLRYKNIHSSSLRRNTEVHDPEFDVAVIGGGIVGTATARELIQRNSHIKLVLLEKESKLAAHQSGHNSGVVHAGIYYQPGSLKARLCTEGIKLAYSYFDAERIPYKKCGKLIVATHEDEVPRLLELYERALKNSVQDVTLVEGERIKDYEPYCQGVKAIWSPHTGIVDWGIVTEHYGQNVVDGGGRLIFNFEVTGFVWSPESQIHSKSKLQYPLRIISKDGKAVRCRFALTCGGLHSDRLAKMSGCSDEPRIIPFRGEYLVLKPEKSHLVKGNIYPVPDPRFPFLGVHFTPRMNGDIWLGPNAVLAFKREGYRWTDFNASDLTETLKFRGFWKLASKFASFGTKEMVASAFPRIQVNNLKRYIPSITDADIIRGPSGVRAQAMSNDGNLVDEFVFEKGVGSNVGQRILHCRNAPSPGATSSLAIAKTIADKFYQEFEI